MGIKENFTQAVKELTGIGGDKKTTQSSPDKSVREGSAPLSQSPKSDGMVEGLKRGLYDDSSTTVPITLDSATQIPQDAEKWEDDDDFMASTVRPLKSAGNSDFESTPAAEEFLSGGELPISLFGQQTGQASRQTEQQPPSFTREPAPQQPQYEESPVQSVSQQVAPPPVQVAPQQVAPPIQSVQQVASQQVVQPVQTVQQQSVLQPIQSVTQQIPPQQTPFYSQPRSMSAMSPSASATSRNVGVDESELTVISRNTIIDGNVRSFADMSIDGDIKGDVETTKNIDLNGKIIGNITCNNAMMHTSQIQGNIRMKGNVSMKRDTLLIGDLMSTYAEVNGKVKGNVDVVGKADLRGDAVVFGDISASTITVEDGAIIQGYVSTTFLNKEESKNLFPDTIVLGDASARA